MKGQAATYNNTYYCINKILRLMGDGNYVCEEDKDNKKLTIQLLSDVEISDGCGFDGTDDWSDCQADWIPLNEMEITLDFNGHYMNFTGSYGLEISYGANVIFTNSGGIKTSQDITNLITVWGADLEIRKSTVPAATDPGKTAGVPSFVSTNEEKFVNVFQISGYSDENGKNVMSHVTVEDAYISNASGVGICFRGGDLDIQYATITAKRAAIENQSRTSDNKICIYDGVFTATDTNPQFYSAAICVMGSIWDEELEPVYGYTYIYGGSYAGYDAVYVNAGKAYISGECTFDGRQDAGFVVFDGTLILADDKSAVLGGKGGAIYAEDSDILVSGGTFTATDASAVCCKNSSVKIKSGSFTCENSNVIEVEGGSLRYKTGLLNDVEVDESNLETTDSVVLTGNAAFISGKKTEGTYHITYVNAEGLCGSEFNPASINADETYSLQELYMPGAFFGGWYTDEACTKEMKELSNVTSDIILYPMFLDEDKNQKKLTTISYETSIYKDCLEKEAFDPGVTILSENKTAQIAYTSSDESIASITQDGKILPTGKVGTTVISGHIPGSDSYFSKDFDISLEIQKHVAVIDCVRPQQAIGVGQKVFSLNAQVKNAQGATAGKLMYSSLNPEVISVDEKGNLKANQEGQALITISMEETENCRADCLQFSVYAKIMKSEINYRGNGGKVSKAEDYLPTGEPFGELPVATREGYEFAGWYTEEQGGTRITGDTIVPVTNGAAYIVYAHWTQKGTSLKPGTDGVKNDLGNATEYTITYKLNKGKNSDKNPKTYTFSTKTISLKAPTRKGYQFAGWYGDRLYKNPMKEIRQGSTGNITLYAKWKKKIYKISYKLKKGKNNKKNPKKYSVTTKTITLKAATRKGYKFAGWYRDKKLKRRVKKIRKGSTGKVTLYAKWIIAK